MLFNSVEYVLLLIGCFSAYWITPFLRVRQYIILIASIYFYMSWSKVFFIMLLIMISLNWLISQRLGKTKDKKWLVLACVLNLGLLAYFKYMNFFLENVQSLGQLYDPTFQSPYLSIILPLGISFYIFELISYHVDLYRGKIEHEKSPVVFAIFVLFFPQLIAGPICRAGQFMPQLHIIQKIDGAQIYKGLYMFLAGFAIKCGVADGLSPFVGVIFSSPESYSGFDNLMAAVGFGIQILCDFWGYSLMALGAALLFGYTLPPNFNLPYAALSIRDFWRRWHMTLSSWLRDYLYISLGGSRSNRAWKVQRNLAITMLLGGLWHGASWNFIIWGAIHGGALVVNRWFELANISSSITAFFRWKPIAWLLTMTVVFVSWIYFRASTLDDAMMMLNQIFTPMTGWAHSKLGPLFFELILLYFPLQYLIHRTTYEKDITLNALWKPALASSILCIFAFLYYVDGTEFIYFQF
ncbi:MBOAT family O-acyltransferase [Marinomonas primoryensis]|uniref:Probable alginate O-acetylase n=1 Tax=Marinomonas primoryensis TaxID=178399 RepID=A0ABV0KYT1_9GAMM